MHTRKLTLGLVLGLVTATGGLIGCSSSSNSPKDGSSNDGGDASTTDAHGDTSGDVATDGGATDAAADGSTDAVALTPLQARGQYLVNVVIGCSDCHTPRNAQGAPDMTKFLAGNPDFITVPTVGSLPSRNLTNDATGLKNRTDDQIKDMILNGKRPIASADGGAGTEPLNSVMPYYVFHNMTDADANAIVAYLRTVPGVKNEIPRRAAGFDVSKPANYLDPNLIPLPLNAYPERESALRGRYLAAESGLCVECHTKHLELSTTNNDVLDTAKLFAGGEDFGAFFAATLKIDPVSANLTSDTTTGLSSWTVADIKKVLSEGKDKQGMGICPPMPWQAYQHLTDQDATDLANYIKSLPPVVNAVPDMCSFPPPATDGGTDGSASDGGADGSTSDGSTSDGSTSTDGGADTGTSSDAGGN
jgi:mono/diheme cytochrome c family protein